MERIYKAAIGCVILAILFYMAGSWYIDQQNQLIQEQISHISERIRSKKEVKLVDSIDIPEGDTIITFRIRELDIFLLTIEKCAVLYEVENVVVYGKDHRNPIWFMYRYPQLINPSWSIVLAIIPLGILILAWIYEGSKS
jgi:hypothetical protein